LLLLSFTRRRQDQPLVCACRPPFLGSIQGLHDQIRDLRGWIRSFPHRIWPGGVLLHRLASRDVASSRTLLSIAYDVFDTMPITARQVRMLHNFFFLYLLRFVLRIISLFYLYINLVDPFLPCRCMIFVSLDGCVRMISACVGLLNFLFIFSLSKYRTKFMIASFPSVNLRPTNFLVVSQLSG